MKSSVKKILNMAFVVLCSALVAGLTTYALTSKNLQSAQAEAQVQPAESGFSMPVAITGPAAMGNVDLTDAAEASVHAVVHIKSTIHGKTQTVDVPQMPDLFEWFFGEGFGGSRQQQIQTQPRVGIGSGVIISKDGYIVTNNHVIEGADEIDVKLNDNREFKGRLIGADASTDLALVKIDGDEFPTLPIGNSDNLKVGEWVLAVGNPFNLT